MSHEMQLPMFVVDVLRYDIEQISNIITLLNDAGGVGWRVFWPRDFNECEVFQALKQLMECGYVEPLIESPEERAIVPFDGAVVSLEQARQLWFVLTQGVGPLGRTGTITPSAMPTSRMYSQASATYVARL